MTPSQMRGLAKLAEYGISAPTVMAMAKSSGLSINAVIARLLLEHDPR